MKPKCIESDNKSLQCESGTFAFKPKSNIPRISTTRWSTFLQVVLQVAPCFECLVAVVAGHRRLYVSRLHMVDQGGFALGMGDLLAGATLQLWTFGCLDSLDVSFHLSLVLRVCKRQKSEHSYYVEHI